MKIKIIESPILNFNHLQKMDDKELNALYGGKGCITSSMKFKIGPTCVCNKKSFLVIKATEIEEVTAIDIE
jgi:hypothetical protein